MPAPTTRSRRARGADDAGAPRHDDRATPTAIRRPPSPTATPVPAPQRPPAARVAADHGAPGRWCSPCSPRSAGLLEPAVQEHRVPRHSGSNRRSAACRSREPDIVRPGLRARDASPSLIALRRHLLRLPRSTARGLERADRDPLDRASSAALAPVLGHAYYYDDGDLAARRRPRPARPPAGSTGSSTPRSSTARSTASAARSSCLSRGVREMQDGLRAPVRARHRARHRRASSSTSCSGSGGRPCDFPILSAIIVTPIIGAIVCLLTPCEPSRRSPRPSATRSTMVDARPRARGCSGTSRPTSARSSSSRTSRWIPTLGVGYIVGVDGISIFMVAITALLFPIGLLASEKYIEHRVKAYIAWFLLLEGAIMGIFLSLDLIAFFVFWELMLVPMYFLIQGWGSERARVRGDEVLHLHRGRLGVPARVHARARRSSTRPTPACSRSTTACSPRGTGSSGTTELRAVPRVHGRVRDQGAAVPVPHLAARSCTPRRRPPARSCWPA